MKSKKAHIGIGRNVTTSEVTNVHGAVGIRKRRRNGIAFRVFLYRHFKYVVRGCR